MQIPTPALVLDMWEQAKGIAPSQRSTEFLTTIDQDCSAQQLRNMSVGCFDAKLIELYRQLFGDKLEALSSCPHCSEDVEFDFDLTDLQPSCSDSPSGHFQLDSHGYRVQFRLPSISDLDAAGESPTEAAARSCLIDRCILSIRKGEQQIQTKALPQKVLESIDRTMLEKDPHGSINFNINCGACNCNWETVFDISKFFWQSLDLWAQQTLNEIHSLASFYGWTESEILAISPWRRRHYLSRVLA